MLTAHNISCHWCGPIVLPAFLRKEHSLLFATILVTFIAFSVCTDLIVVTVLLDHRRAKNPIVLVATMVRMILCVERISFSFQMSCLHCRFSNHVLVALLIDLVSTRREAFMRCHVVSLLMLVSVLQMILATLRVRRMAPSS